MPKRIIIIFFFSYFSLNKRLPFKFCNALLHAACVYLKIWKNKHLLKYVLIRANEKFRENS